MSTFLTSPLDIRYTYFTVFLTQSFAFYGSKNVEEQMKPIRRGLTPLKKERSERIISDICSYSYGCGNCYVHPYCKHTLDHLDLTWKRLPNGCKNLTNPDEKLFKRPKSLWHWHEVWRYKALFWNPLFKREIFKTECFVKPMSFLPQFHDSDQICFVVLTLYY